MAISTYSNVNNPHARTKVLQIMSELDLIDMFRELNPEKRRFTWQRKNPIKQARLDYFLTSRSMTDLTGSCSIQPSYRSDHLYTRADHIHQQLCYWLWALENLTIAFWKTQTT